MSVLIPTADVNDRKRLVRFVPNADIFPQNRNSAASPVHSGRGLKKPPFEATIWHNCRRRSPAARYRRLQQSLEQVFELSRR
jgi:hypothetical protein